MSNIQIDRLKWFNKHHSRGKWWKDPVVGFTKPNESKPQSHQFENWPRVITLMIVTRLRIYSKRWTRSVYSVTRGILMFMQCSIVPDFQQWMATLPVDEQEVCNWTGFWTSPPTFALGDCHRSTLMFKPTPLEFFFGFVNPTTGSFHHFPREWCLLNHFKRSIWMLDIFQKAPLQNPGGQSFRKRTETGIYLLKRGIYISKEGPYILKTPVKSPFGADLASQMHDLAIFPRKTERRWRVNTSNLPRQCSEPSSPLPIGPFEMDCFAQVVLFRTPPNKTPFFGIGAVFVIPLLWACSCKCNVHDCLRGLLSSEAVGSLFLSAVLRFVRGNEGSRWTSEQSHI